MEGLSARISPERNWTVRHTLCEVPHDQISRTCWIDLMLELNMPVGAIDVSDQISELERLAAVIFSRYRSQCAS